MMKISASLVLAAVLAMSGATAASAGYTSKPHNSMSKTHKTMGASDALSLSGEQQKSIWKDLSRQAANQNAPAGFNAAVGSEIPNSMKTYPMPRQAARDVPASKRYRYAMTEDKVLIVNPADHKIADVVSKP